MTAAVLWLADLGQDDVEQAGGKGANLGELIRADLPVPPGFVVTAETYRQYLVTTGLAHKITKSLDGLDVHDREAVREASQRISNGFATTALSDEVAAQIRLAYGELGSPAVAVRSSATAEDLPEASFAGQQLTFLNVSGSDDVLESIRRCWASLYEPQAIFYRAQRGYRHEDVAIAVPVQKMVQPMSAGVMFTVNPLTAADDEIYIEAVWGLGEAAVSGQVTPDTYVVGKQSLAEVERSVVPQEMELVSDLDARAPQTTVWRGVAATRRDKPKLSQEQTLRLARLGIQAEYHFGRPQDVEWAIEHDHLFVLQARPVTTLG